MRLFLALWPDEATRDALGALQAAWHWPPAAARVPREKLHVTLHFLGAVPPARLDALRAVARVRGQPFELTGDGARQQVWPGGIAVLEVVAPAPLRQLHAALAAELQAQEFPVEARPYRPHVTFARKAWGARPPAAVPPFRWTCDGAWSLVRSSPREGYQVVETHGPH